MVAKKYLVKLAVAISAVTIGVYEARHEKEKHPLLQADSEVDTVLLPDGSISKRLHLLNSSREKSYAEI